MSALKSLSVKLQIGIYKKASHTSGGFFNPVPFLKKLNFGDCDDILMDGASMNKVAKTLLKKRITTISS